MKFKSLVFAQASGSTGGLTYSHNKGGMYARSRSIPINPATAAQQIVRNALKTLSTRWQNTLTPLQRAAWTTYAANVPLLNALGEPMPIPALSMYIRCNSPRLQFLIAPAIVDNGPTTYSLATFTLPIPTRSTTNLQIAFTNTDAWATTTGGALFVFISRGQASSINFYKGPFRFVTAILGNTTTPPTSPVTPSSPFGNLLAGQRYFVRFRATNSDGRLSSDMITSFDA